MIKCGVNPYESFKNDRDRLFALISRDVRIVLVAALFAGAAGRSSTLHTVILGWMA